VTEARAREGRFLAAHDPAQASSAYAAIVGLPWDGAVTYRSGASAGPDAIRAASDSIESYCPKLDLDLEDGTYVDLGNLAIPPPDPDTEVVTRALCRRVAELPELALLGLGGDHLAAYPFLERALARWPDLQIFHLDAHGDLRDDWEGQRFNHSTVLRRVLERMVLPARLWQWGIRSGTRAEFELARTDPRIERVDNTPAAGLACAAALAGSGRPLYVTLDVDGLDPADVPGTGTPEPDGLRFGAVEAALGELLRAPRARGTRLVGADVVELAPGLDPTGRSAVACARLARTLLLLLRELR
jgi:agmatinase